MRPCCSSAVGGRSFPVGPFEGSLFSNGFVQLVSISGGAIVVGNPPVKNKMSAPAIVQPALLSAFRNMANPLYAAASSDRAASAVARMLNANMQIPAKISPPEKKRTSQIGLRAITVSMNGMVQSFHCHPCQNPPSHRVTKNANPSDHHHPIAPIGKRVGM